MERVAVVLLRLVTVREGGEGCAVCVCASDKINMQYPVLNVTNSNTTMYILIMLVTVGLP